MQPRQAVVVVVLVAAVCCVMLTAVTVRRHAEAVQALEGISLRLVGVEVQPQSEVPLLVEVEAGSGSDYAYFLDSIRLVLRHNDTIVGTRPETEVSDKVHPGSSLRLRLQLEPGSEYEDAEAQETLVDADPARWTVHGFMDVSPASGRDEERWEFRVQGVDPRD